MLWNLNNVNKLQPLMEFQCMFVSGPHWTLGASLVNYGVRFDPAQSYYAASDYAEVEVERLGGT